ncbi:glycoside hydrolase family 47 protein [Teratosphaeria destructans]|uniref:alpha-1,2-Mannosidase n=1 Tax=Teratosphaeria destructans TaxID=418781 RepID=A0A9W7SR08_9PEZI|nr:glycoside hydrolase family 47 protein [Teratosphaeria destructans]
MVPKLRRWVLYSILVASILFVTSTTVDLFDRHCHRRRGKHQQSLDRILHPGLFQPKFKWANLVQQHPVQNLTTLPDGPLAHIPRIQHEFEPETYEEKVRRQKRLNAVKEAFLHSWEGYKRNAWLQDELTPLSGGVHNLFGGWGVTLCDSLDTLWIMGLQKEFAAAVADLNKIDFTTTPLDNINIFETTIRYMGGFLSAYDLSGHRYGILLEKAVALGEMLYHAFDTPNRMPVTRWDWKNAALGGPQEAARFSLLAEVGSFTLEFTRLSQLTGDHKYYDAIARITNVFEEQQNRTKLPGLFPTMLDTKNADFTRDRIFTLGGMADSLYEYLPKQHLMLGGRSEQYRKLYTTAIKTAKEHIFFRPLNPDNQKILLAGTLKQNSAARKELIPQGEHLTCFAGGMVALAAKAFQQTHDLEIARQLVDGCLWAYESMPSGIMPENFYAAPCREGKNEDHIAEHNCTWSEEKWHHAIAKHRSPPTSRQKIGPTKPP